MKKALKALTAVAMCALVSSCMTISRPVAATTNPFGTKCGVAKSTIYLGLWSSKGGENGIELAYKGKKEILRTYGIEGEDLTLKKLHKELNLLKDILIKENYQGNLGVSQAPKQSTKPKPAKQKEATNNQKQQRTRNRIPSGH